MSHSLFAHATSSLSSVLFGADGQKSCDCEPKGKDKGTVADGTETKDIKTHRRNANIPIHAIVDRAIVDRAGRERESFFFQKLRKVTRVTVLACVCV